MRQECLGDQERTFGVDCKYEFPLFFLKILDHADSEHARVVDQRVDAPRRRFA
jgi:hypothetical protein